jgi:hypothetical protein
MQATGIQLYAPDSTDVPSLSKEVFPYDTFMGKWHVVWSTLPLWNVSVLSLRVLMRSSLNRGTFLGQERYLSNRMLHGWAESSSDLPVL